MIASAVALVVLTATMIVLLALRDHDPDVAEAEPRTDAEASSTVPPGAPGTSGDVFSVTHRLSRDLAGLLPTAAEEPLPESSAAPPVSAEGSPPPAPGSLPTPPSDRPLTTADIVARSEPSVAKIAGPSSSGSGFLAGPGLVATNAHVVEGELIQDLRVTFPSAPAGRQGPFQPELILLDAGRDLAILRVPSDLPPLPVAPTYTFRKGEDVTIIGSPGIGPQVLENAVSRGVLSTRIQVEGQDFYQLSAAVNPGNSGGPVFDSFGRVIGVVTWKARQGEALAFCITAEDLNRGLTRAESEAVRPPDQRLLAQLPRLSYAWKPGEAYQYEVKVEYEGTQARVTYEGTSTYTVLLSDAEKASIAHRGSITRRSQARGRNGGSPGSSESQQTKDVNLQINHYGQILQGDPDHPIPFLGDVADLVLEPLPKQPLPDWQIVKPILLRQTQVHTTGLPLPGSSLMPDFGPSSRLRPSLSPRFGRPTMPSIGPRFGRPTMPRPAPTQHVEVTEYRARELTRYRAATEPENQTIKIAKIYELRTEEEVSSGQPRLGMTGTGTILFDVSRGMPRSVTFHATITENNGKARDRSTVTLHCQLVGSMKP